MGVFDFFTLEDDAILPTSWIEWYHQGIPDEVGPEREMVRLEMFAQDHCLECTSMDACYYAKAKMPDYRPHGGCHCKIFDVDFSVVKENAWVECDIKKFTEYIFNKGHPQNGGKYELFTSWGYDITDSEYLRDEIMSQAIDQYLSGNYEIRGNSGYGTIVKITVNVDGRIFGTGWIIQPKGGIKNTTPYADNK